MKLLNTLSICLPFVSSAVFAAGYILPNGTILYDGSNDATMYRIEKFSVERSAPAQPQSQVISSDGATRSVVIENRTVVYEQPVYIKERVVDRRPFYDVVDVAGAVLVYGLIYDATRHSFYHHDLHRGYPNQRFRH